MAIRIGIQASDAVMAYVRSFGETLESYAPSRRAVAATCNGVGVTTAEVSITWLRDDEIAELNQEYLEHTGATDVISFHLYEPGELPVGDIYIGYEQAARQAAAYGCTRADELVRLAVHGTLHVLGFEHPEDADRTDSAMWLLQEAIVSELTQGTSAAGRRAAPSRKTR
jgi:probable rRNA maturation factor